jgi:predicted O-methyltransferase YrrM
MLHSGDALEIIPEIDGQFDMVFIDGNKQQYLSYYHLVFPRLRTGGYILADNVLWDGKVLSQPKRHDKYTKGIAEFNDFLAGDDRVEQMILPMRDGLTLIRKVAE